MLKHLSSMFSKRQAQESQPKKAELDIALSEQDKELVVPMIKAIVGPGAPAEGTELHLSFEQSPISRPFAADMIVMYALNRPSHLEYISNEIASATGLDSESIHELAIKNLPSHLGEVLLHDCGEGIYGISAGGNFEASLLLLDQVWEQLEKYFPGEPFAAVPSRDVLFVVGSDRPNARELIAAKARIDLPEKRYAISQSVLVRREGKWLARAN
ncbi:MAG: DUF1444 family protein [Rhizobacter sp.]|nr:DUF1444 family protein [Rhizobacter sp.]